MCLFIYISLFYVIIKYHSIVIVYFPLYFIEGVRGFYCKYLFLAFSFNSIVYIMSPVSPMS